MMAMLVWISLLGGLVMFEMRAAVAESNQTLSFDEETTRGQWYPTITATGYYGREYEKDKGLKSTTIDTDDVSLTIKQPLWDFGGRTARHDLTKVSIRQRQELYDGVRNDLLFNADYSQDIQKLAQQEQVRMTKGKGSVTDRLRIAQQQAVLRTQAATVVARYEEAVRKFKTMFGIDDVSLTNLQMMTVHTPLLPSTLDDVLEIAFRENPNLEVFALSVETAAVQRDKTRYDAFTPSVDLLLSSRFNREYNEEEDDHKQDHKALIQFSLSFNGGLSEYDRIQADHHRHLAQTNRYNDARDRLTAGMVKAWHKIEEESQQSLLIQSQITLNKTLLRKLYKRDELQQDLIIKILETTATILELEVDLLESHYSLSESEYKVLHLMGRMREGLNG